MKIIMQSIVEQMVKRKISHSNIAEIILLTLFSVVSSTVLLMFREALPAFTFIFILFMVLILVSAYFLMTLLCVEYEYRLVGDELEIDKITAYKMRKNIIKLSLKNIDKIGCYNKAEHEYISYSKRVIACEDIKSTSTWYITVKNSGGKMLIVMTPSYKILESMKRYIPKQLAFEVFVKGQKT